MNQSVLLFCIWLSAASVAVAGEDQYVLRVDTMGYVDSLEECPKETLLHSIEVVARPGETFHCKVKTGSQTLVMSGKLQEQDGEFRVRIRYARSVDTGVIVAGQPVQDQTELKTTVRIAVGKSVLIGGMTNTVDVPPSKSREHHLLFLSKYAPAVF